MNLEKISHQLAGDGYAILLAIGEDPFRLIYIEPDDIGPEGDIPLGKILRRNGQEPGDFRGRILFGKVSGLEFKIAHEF